MCVCPVSQFGGSSCDGEPLIEVVETTTVPYVF